MSYQFTMSPDFNAAQLSPWYIFNNRLQKFIGDSCHLELYDDFQSLRGAEEAGKVDIIFANAFDTAFLVREKNFIPVAKGADRSDEALVAVSADSQVSAVSDFQPGLKVAATDAPDVEMIGRILLEPADLDRDNVQVVRSDNYVTVAKSLMNGDADAGFFLRASYDDLSELVRKSLKPVVSSHIYVVCHALLISPALESKHEELIQALVGMKSDSEDAKLLEELGMPEGWATMDREEAEFMIDMMDTLLP
jgi:phosphonate transport system substrate-binding protein